MLHAGLDLSRRRLDVGLIDGDGEVVAQLVAPPDAEGLRRLVERVGPQGRIRGVIESMTGARFVRDTLEELGWEVLVADAQKVRGLAPLACKTDRIDAQVLAVLSHRDLVRRSGFLVRGCAASASRRACGCIWSSIARCPSTASTRRF
jgi:transposase